MDTLHPLSGAPGRPVLRAGGLVAALCLATAGPAAAQNSRPSVFFDCAGPRCDSRYYRTEINWVHWVNDKEDATVHVMMTSQGTGAGGREYLLDFIGVGEQDGYRNQHSFRSLPTDTDREQLDGIAHTLGLGLALFASHSGYRGLVALTGNHREEEAIALGVVSRDEVEDPWNLWVFRIDGETGIDGETSERRVSLEGGLSASRVSPTLRLRFSGDVEHDRYLIELSDGTFEDHRTRWSLNSRAVYAVLEHWSVGVDASGSRNPNYNQDLRLELAPALEYSVFPYEEATRRSFTFFYRVGPGFRDYVEPTIYGETEETRWEQAMEVRFTQRQPWGNASVNARGSHFLHDLDRRLLSFGGDLSFRIVRGLELSFSGNVSSVADQIYLPVEEATDEEALLQLQQRATDFDYGIEVGFQFRFGSIFNNVVNNRFRRRWF